MFTPGDPDTILKTRRAEIIREVVAGMFVVLIFFFHLFLLVFLLHVSCVSFTCTQTIYIHAYTTDLSLPLLFIAFSLVLL